MLRTLVGAAFLGAVTDAMLLGHWYLVQPGLPRRLLHELVDAVAVIWPIEVIALLIPTGMVSVWSGSIDDGWGGMLGWMWAACAVTTIVLVVVTKAALRERAVLGRDGGDRPALPGHPHRLRHRPRRPGRPVALTYAGGEAELRRSPAKMLTHDFGEDAALRVRGGGSARHHGCRGVRRLAPACGNADVDDRPDGRRTAAAAAGTDIDRAARRRRQRSPR